MKFPTEDPVETKARALAAREGVPMSEARSRVEAMVDRQARPAPAPDDVFAAMSLNERAEHIAELAGVPLRHAYRALASPVRKVSGRPVEPAPGRAAGPLDRRSLHAWEALAT